MVTLAGFTRNRLAAIQGATVPAPDRPARPSLAGRSAGHAAVPRERPASPPRCETEGAPGGEGCSGGFEAPALDRCEGFGVEPSPPVRADQPGAVPRDLCRPR